MGQKVNPAGLRLGINKDWDSKWYANKKNFSKPLDKPIFYVIMCLKVKESQSQKMR